MKNCLVGKNGEEGQGGPLSRIIAASATSPLGGLPSKRDLFYTPTAASPIPRSSARPHKLLAPFDATMTLPCSPVAGGSGINSNTNGKPDEQGTAKTTVPLPSDQVLPPSDVLSMPTHFSAAHTAFAGKLFLTCFKRGSKMVGSEARNADTAVLDGTATAEQLLKVGRAVKQVNKMKAAASPSGCCIGLVPLSCAVLDGTATARDLQQVCEEVLAVICISKDNVAAWTALHQHDSGTNPIQQPEGDAAAIMAAANTGHVQ